MGFLYLVVIGPAHGQDTLSAESKIEKVTLFFSGAEVQREVTVSVNSKKTLVRFDDLPLDIRSNSVQVNIDGNAKIIGVKRERQEFLGASKSQEEKSLEAIIDEIEEVGYAHSIRLKALDQEWHILNKNNDFTRRDGSSDLTEVQQAAEFYSQKIESILTEKRKIRNEMESLTDSIEVINKRIQRLQTKRFKPQSIVSVSLEPEGPNTEVTVRLSYFVDHAGWTPKYDFRVLNTNEPLTIVYLANVFQSTGENWSEVQMTLIPDVPRKNNTRPILKRWYSGERIPQYELEEKSFEGSSWIEGTVVDASIGEPVAYAAISIYAGGELIHGTTTNYMGKYMIKPIPEGRYSVKCSFIGYEETSYSNVNLKPLNGKKVNFTLYENKGTLVSVDVIGYTTPLIDPDKQGRTSTGEEIQNLPQRDVASLASTAAGVYQVDNGSGINVRGSRSDATEVYVEGIKAAPLKNTSLLSNTDVDRLTGVSYKINVPYTVPSDGRDYEVRLKQVEIGVDYKYYSAPIADPGVFLVARIPEWTRLDLSEGSASLYCQGTFRGETWIDPQSTKDTLELGLGRDPSIVVTRELNTKLYSKKILSKSQTELVFWDLSIRNTKSEAISITIVDQIPVETAQWTNVEILNIDGGKLEDKTGFVTWELIVPGGSLEKRQLGFEQRTNF